MTVRVFPSPRALLLALVFMMVAVLAPGPRARAEIGVASSLWDLSSSPVGFCTHQADRPESVSADQFTDSVARAIQTWNAVGAALTLRYDGECAFPTLDADASNGVNEIGFVDTLDGSDSVVGVTLSTFIVGGPRTESDVLLLAEPTLGLWTPCKLQQNITHELGHVMGLGHSDLDDDLMAVANIDCGFQFPSDETTSLLVQTYGAGQNPPPRPELVVDPISPIPPTPSLERFFFDEEAGLGRTGWSSVGASWHEACARGLTEVEESCATRGATGSFPGVLIDSDPPPDYVYTVPDRFIHETSLKACTSGGCSAGGVGPLASRLVWEQADADFTLFALAFDYGRLQYTVAVAINNAGAPRAFTFYNGTEEDPHLRRIGRCGTLAPGAVCVKLIYPGDGDHHPLVQIESESPGAPTIIVPFTVR